MAIKPDSRGTSHVETEFSWNDLTQGTHKVINTLKTTTLCTCELANRPRVWPLTPSGKATCQHVWQIRIEFGAHYKQQLKHRWVWSTRVTNRPYVRAQTKRDLESDTQRSDHVLYVNWLLHGSTVSTSTNRYPSYITINANCEVRTSSPVRCVQLS